MARKGIDISRQASKSLEQVPNWEKSQAIIALNARALEGLPLRSSKPVVLTWPIPDPIEASSQPGDARNAAFESAFQAIESNLKDLAAAVLDEPQP
jgi:protein-tyrosine-phosphatase